MDEVPAGRGAQEEQYDEVVAFVSYSRDDGTVFVQELQERLGRMPFRVQAWTDHQIAPDSGFDHQIERQLRGCDVVLFVMTPASVVDSPWCARELLTADEAGKDIVPLQFQEDLTSPLVIKDRPPVLLVGPGSAPGWNELERRLRWYASPWRRLVTLEEEAGDIQLRMASAGEQAGQRLGRRLEQVTRRIGELRIRLADPGAARDEQRRRIQEGLRSERSTPGEPTVAAHVLVMGSPPQVPPGQFTDRESEVSELIRRVNAPGPAVIVLHGRDGIGKTAILHRVWQRFLAGDGGQEPIGLDYLSAVGVEPLTADALVRALTRQIRTPEGVGHRATQADTSSWVDRMSDALVALGQQRVLLALDAVDELLDDSMEFEDRDLADAIDVLIRQPGHQVKLLLATRTAPQPLLDRAGERALQVPRTAGLPVERVAELVATMDSGQRVGWSAIPGELLHLLHERTGGSPRAIELCHGILLVDDRETPARLVDMLQQRGNEDSVEVLLGRAFELLGRDERLVVQALAVFRRPVQAAAVEWLLQDHLPGADVRSFLEALCVQRVVRREAGLRYTLPATPDGDYVLGTLPRGRAPDRELSPVPLTQLGLLRRAADYWVDVRGDRPVTGTDALRPQLNEIETRIRGEEYKRALELMTDVDERYLVGWGHSGILIRALTKLLAAEGAAEPLRRQARTLLVRALFQQERVDVAMPYLERGLRELSRSWSQEARVRMEIQRATALSIIGHLPEAKEGFRSAVRRTVPSGLNLLTADALVGQAWCVAREGEFGRAMRLTAAARLLLGWKQERLWLRANLFEARGWVHGRLGNRDRAAHCLEVGVESARRCGDRLAEGHLLRSQADLMLDQGHAAQALSLADDAARLGAGMSGRALFRGAQQTIALARLCLGDLHGAAHAAAIATRYRPTVDGLVMAGLIAYRKDGGDDRTAAQEAFQRAHVMASDERARNDRDFALVYIHALAQVGMALCGVPGQVDAAVGTFAAGRKIAAPPGVVDRNLLLLDLFGADGGGPITRFRRAAQGS